MAKSWNDFLGKKPIAPAPKAHVPQAIERFEAIPEGADLHTLKESSVLLRTRYKYKRGISVTTLRTHIAKKRLKQDVHYIKVGSVFHLYLPAVAMALRSL